MTVKLIYAQSANGVIGVDNRLPWHLEADLKRFKALTKGHIVVMGRKTWESLPDAFRPLPDRLNIVLSRNPDFQLEGAIVKTSLEDVIKDYSESELWIIGGESLFKEGLHFAKEIFITNIFVDIMGDTYAPCIDAKEWLIASQSEVFSDDQLEYQFLTYRRTSNVSP